ncbi:hypothetical protein [Labedaea rhizosphaerae]|uniref:hypothetical protein n=1 Tax=Labedaea rhizosphaerae TaxID=598644 RepID=UPI001061426F|nr:hypothetical protein [Labedaea rhizosphaerae]
MSERSVAVTARELTDGTITARELVAAGAWQDRDDVRAAARAADERRAAGSPLPLLGLPVALDASVRDASSARAAGAVVLGTVRDAIKALDMGAYAVLGRPDGTTPSWRPAGARIAVLTRHVADLPLLGPLLGVTTPPADHLDDLHHLHHLRIGAQGDDPEVAEAATRLSLAGLRVVDVDRRLTSRLARLRGADPLAGADVLITAAAWPVPLSHAAVTAAGRTFAAPRPTEHVALHLARELAR